MPRPKSSQPTDVELRILQILWEIAPCGVRNIHQRLEAEKGTNYSTTVKMLAVMREKGLVKRDEKATPHVYRASMTQERAQKNMLNDLIKRVYDGSASSLVLHALSGKKASSEEIDEIEKLIAKMKQGDKQ